MSLSCQIHPLRHPILLTRYITATSQAFATASSDPNADDGELRIGTVEHVHRLHTQKVAVARLQGPALGLSRIASTA